RRAENLRALRSPDGNFPRQNLFETKRCQKTIQRQIRVNRAILAQSLFAEKSSQQDGGRGRKSDAEYSPDQLSGRVLKDSRAQAELGRFRCRGAARLLCFGGA